MLRMRSIIGRAIVLLLIAAVTGQIAAPVGACASEAAPSAPMKCAEQQCCCCGTAESEANCCCGNGNKKSETPTPPQTDHSQFVKWAVSSIWTYLSETGLTLGDVAPFVDSDVLLFFGRPLQPVLCIWRI